MKPSRLTKRLLVSGLSLVLVLIIGVVWGLLSTEWGVRTVWPYVEGRFPEGLHVGSVSGRLRSPLTLHDIRYEQEGMAARVGSVRIAWRLAPLLRRALHIEGLEVEDVVVDVTLSEADEPVAPPRLPALSLSLLATVDQAVVRGVSVRVADGDPVELDSISVRDLSLGDRFTVGAVAAAAGSGQVHASGWVEPLGDYALSAEVEVDGEMPGYAPVQGRFSLSGTLAQVVVAASVTRPLAAELSATVNTPRYHPTFDARLVVSEADAQMVRADLPPIRASGTFDASGSVDSLRLEATAEFQTPQTGPVSVNGVVLRADTTVRIERMSATARGARMGMSGTITLAPAAPVMDLFVGARALRWPLEGDPQVRVDTAWATVRGTTTAYRLAGGARGETAAGPAGRVAVRGTGTRERFAISDLRLNTLDGLLQAEGSVAWTPEPSWNLRVSLDDMDTSPLLPDSSAWTGRMTLRGQTSGRVGTNGTDGDFAVEELTGVLAGGEVTGVVVGAFRLPVVEPGAAPALPFVSFDTLDLEFGPNSLWASGSIWDSLDVDLRLRAPDLAVLSTDLRGELDVEGRLTGSRSTPRIEARVLGHGLGFVDSGIEEISLQVEVDSETGGVVAAEGLATGLTSGELLLDSLTLTVRGNPQLHTVTARLAGTRGSLDVDAAGGIEDRQWIGSLSSFDFGLDPVGRWSLGDTVALVLSAGQGAVQRGCWHSGSAQACAEGSWERGGATAFRASVRDLDLERFEGSLREEWTLGGALTADAAVTIAADSALDVDASADFGSGLIGYPTDAGRRELHYSGAEVALRTDVDGTRAQAAFMLSAGEVSTVAQLTGHVELPTYSRMGMAVDSQAVSGRLQVSVQDFSALEAMLTSVEDLTGEVDVDVSLSGTVAVPELQGEARLQGGGLDVPRLGMELREAEMTAVGVGREGFALQGQARSGSGTVQVSGGIPAVPSADNPVRIQVSGDQFQAVDVAEVSVWVSPELEVVAFPGRVDLTGTVLIPRARIELTEMSSAGITPSRDVVFVDDTASARVRGPDIYSSVRIVLGDSVSLRGFGLTAQPRGGILATDVPGRATTATGEIDITGGRYKAYGQSLEIERGRVLYAGGPLDNPGLDIRATRRARDGVVAGLDVRGTLLRPDASIFSEPAMLQSDALAYIILGRPLGTASTSEGSAVANAATSLGIRGGNILAGRIGQRFGLEEVRIEAEGPLDAASLIAGKYLSPRLYVSYGVGLFEPINTFRMRYQVSSLWTLQAETGKATSADLLYRIERGR